VIQTEDFWADFCERERDEEVEHVRARELAHQERLDEKGGAFRCNIDESAGLAKLPRRPARFSQCLKILNVLEDGDWHTTSEILRAVPSIVHSRIAELRKRGYIIEHETTGTGANGSRYRLVERQAA
jgi:hypothetical protein